MEPNQQQAAQVVMQQPTVTPIQPKRKLVRTLLIISTVLLFVVAVALGYLYYEANKEQKNLLASNTALQNDIKGMNGIVDALVEEQKKAVFPDDVNNFTPQCKGSNQDNLLIAKLNRDPVQNHNAYLTICRNDLQDKDLLVRATVLKVDDKGNETFVYGAGSGEPRCISSKTLGAVAADLQKTTGLPNCKTF